MLCLSFAAPTPLETAGDLSTKMKNVTACDARNGIFVSTCATELKFLTDIVDNGLGDLNSAHLQAFTAVQSRLGICATRCPLCSCKKDVMDLADDITRIYNAQFSTDQANKNRKSIFYQTNQVYNQEMFGIETERIAIAASNEKSCLKKCPLLTLPATAQATTCRKACQDTAAVARRAAGNFTEKHAIWQARPRSDAWKAANATNITAVQAQIDAEQGAAKRAALISSTSATLGTITALTNGNTKLTNFTSYIGTLKLPFTQGTLPQGGSTWFTDANKRDIPAFCTRAIEDPSKLTTFDTVSALSTLFRDTQSRVVRLCQEVLTRNKLQQVLDQYAYAGDMPSWLPNSASSVLDLINPKIAAFTATIIRSKAALSILTGPTPART